MIPQLLLVFSPLLFVVCQARPDRALMLWLFLSPLANGTELFGVDLRVITFDRLAFFATLLALLHNGQLGNLIPCRWSKFEKAFLVFVIVFMFEAFLKFHPRDAFSVCTNTFDSYVIPFYLYLLSKYVLTRNGLYDETMEGRIAKVLTIVGFYCAAMSIYEGLTTVDLLPGPAPDGLRVAGGSMRTNGPFWVPGMLGLYLSWIMLLTMYRWRVRRMLNPDLTPVRKLFAVPYAILMLSGLFFVMFRNAWGGFLGACSVRYLFSRRGRLAFLLVLALIGVGAAFGWQDIIQSKVYQDRITNTSTIYDRLAAWRYAFRAFSENPVTGIGGGQMRFYIRNAREKGIDLRVMDYPAAIHPHNTVISMLAENGLLGVVPACLVFWFFLGEIRACYHLARSPADVEFSLYAISAAFAILAPGLTDRSFEWAKSNNLMYVIFAFVTAHHAKLVRAFASPEADELPIHTPGATSEAAVAN